MCYTELLSVPARVVFIIRHCWRLNFGHGAVAGSQAPRLPASRLIVQCALCIGCDRFITGRESASGRRVRDDGLHLHAGKWRQAALGTPPHLHCWPYTDACTVEAWKVDVRYAACLVSRGSSVLLLPNKFKARRACLLSQIRTCRLCCGGRARCRT